jgi:hypothetical protein
MWDIRLKGIIEMITNKITQEIDTIALDDLRLFIDNEATLHHNRVVPMIKNVARKLKNGTYDANLAPKLWIYLVDAGIELYIKDFGGNKKMFPKPLRYELAKQYAEYYLEEIKLGNYSMLLGE